MKIFFDFMKWEKLDFMKLEMGAPTFCHTITLLNVGRVLKESAAFLEMIGSEGVRY